MSRNHEVPVLISEREIRDIVERQAVAIREYCLIMKRTNITLVPVLTGAFMYAADLLRALSRLNQSNGGVQIDWSVDFIDLGSYGDQTVSSGKPRIYKDLKSSPAGKHVVIVEDIVDTGQAMDWLLNHLRQHEPASLEIATFLRKPSRTIIDVKPRFVGQVIEDKFVVGYGMDYAQDYRGLPYIGIKKP